MTSLPVFVQVVVASPPIVLAVAAVALHVAFGVVTVNRWSRVIGSLLTGPDRHHGNASV
jgi:hypothetical protein